LQWLGWAAATLLLSLVGAVFISRLINLPLSRLAGATRVIAKGQQPAPLPETGPAEVREANRSFNHMVRDLQQIEADRAIILAGISHDLRTPISRMLLEVEMANLTPEAREGMQGDLRQMDAIIGQFLDYARPTDSSRFTTVDLSALLGEAAREATRLPEMEVKAEIKPGLNVAGNATDLRRVVNNLVENARRYGKNAATGTVTLDIRAAMEGDKAVVEIGDRGPGVPDGEIEHMLRPFTRMDLARGQANGSGLGLAIVDRVLQRHGAALRLTNRNGGGLLARITLPLAKGKRTTASA
ncbi:MAG: ATP-binding protein, partial [Noviherbaspirillum sp.]